MSKHNTTKKQILIVEGNQSKAATIAKALKSSGYTTSIINNGEDALKAAVDHKPDLIITNIMLPKVSGWDVMDILKRTPETQDIPIIVLSGLSRDDDKQRAADLGAADYLVVSEVKAKDVVQAVNKHLQENTTMLGLSQQEYDKTAGEYSKGAITIWIIVGLLFNLLTGKLFSIASILLILPGVFVIAFASIPFFFLDVKKKKAVTAMNEHESMMLFATGKRPGQGKNIPAMLGWTLVTIIEWLFPAALAIVAMSLVHNL